MVGELKCERKLSIFYNRWRNIVAKIIYKSPLPPSHCWCKFLESLSLLAGPSNIETGGGGDLQDDFKFLPCITSTIVAWRDF